MNKVVTKNGDTSYYPKSLLCHDLKMVLNGLGELQDSLYVRHESLEDAQALLLLSVKKLLEIYNSVTGQPLKDYLSEDRK